MSVCTSMKVKFYTSIFAQDEVSDVSAILYFVYIACHDTNDKYYKSDIHVVSWHFPSVELFTFADFFQKERHEVHCKANTVSYCRSHY